MRFNLLSLLLLVTVVALAIVLLLKRKPDKMLLMEARLKLMNCRNRQVRTANG